MNAVVKQVKVDNWGIFFLQRLKNFFNRTSYCDLTLQFHDNAQLKVHRLVLNACTEYFEILEQTCEMHDDCLIMPDDMQADVVVPIVNFMYTGQLEYNYNLFERLYSTAQIMKMTVLTKLLNVQRTSSPPPIEQKAPSKPPRTLNNEYLNEAREYPIQVKEESRPFIKHSYKRPERSRSFRLPAPQDPAKPTRYELPDELEDDIFEPSFSNISYESRSLLTQKTLRKQDDIESNSRKFLASKRPSTSVAQSDSKRMFLDMNHESTDVFDSIISTDYEESLQQDDVSTLYSHSLESDSKGYKFKAIEGSSGVNHAKVISEVLKQYPHILKSNKNIKVRIVTPKASPPKASVVKLNRSELKYDAKTIIENSNKPEWTYISKDLHNDSIEKLVQLGLDNKSGPWLCLMCGTPTKALNFTSYYAYRRHMIEVHLEKASSMTCEYCGHRSARRNHLLHHMYSRHGVPPPANYSFPKCNRCPYIALTEGNLAKHKLIHKDAHMCAVCFGGFTSRQNLAHHVHMTGHTKVDKKQPSQCAYCNKTFHRAPNLYAHYKSLHKTMAETDGILEPSDDDENPYDDEPMNIYDRSQDEVHIKQESDGKFQIISKASQQRPFKQTLLNTTLNNPAKAQLAAHDSSQDAHSADSVSESDILPHVSSESINMDQIVVLNDNEIIIRPENYKNKNEIFSDPPNDELIVPEILEPPFEQASGKLHKPTLSYGKLKKTQATAKDNIVTSRHQPIIVVSENQQYKTILTSQPLVYSTGKEATLASMAGGISQIHGLNIDASQAQNLMVLPDGFSIPQQGLKGENHNIVVVYSHPIGDSQKQFMQIAPQYSVIQTTTTHEIDSSQIDESKEYQPQENILLDDNLVHETVETWQEENEAEEIQGEIEESEMREIESVQEEIIPITSETSASAVQPVEDEILPRVKNNHNYTLQHTGNIQLENDVILQPITNIDCEQSSNTNNVGLSQIELKQQGDLTPATLYYVESHPVQPVEDHEMENNAEINSESLKSGKITWVPDPSVKIADASQEDPEDLDKGNRSDVEETIENIEVEVQKITQNSKCDRSEMVENVSEVEVNDGETTVLEENVVPSESIIMHQNTLTHNVTIREVPTVDVTSVDDQTLSQEITTDTSFSDQPLPHEITTDTSFSDQSLPQEITTDASFGDQPLPQYVELPKCHEKIFRPSRNSAILQLVEHVNSEIAKQGPDSIELSSNILQEDVTDDSNQEASEKEATSVQIQESDLQIEVGRENDSNEEENYTREDKSILEESVEEHPKDSPSPQRITSKSEEIALQLNGKPDDKISTLLDDWEDNESQADADKDDEDVKDDDEKHEEEKAKTITTLVSDWDD